MNIASNLNVDSTFTIRGTSAIITSAGAASFQSVSASSISAISLYDTNFAGSKVVISNSDKSLGESATTSTEIGYVSGVTSSIQSQLNSKQATLTTASNIIVSSVSATSITVDNLTESGTLISNKYLKLSGGQLSGRLNLYKNGATSVDRLIHGFGFADAYSGLVSFYGSEANAINAINTSGAGASDGPFIFGYGGVSIGYSSVGTLNQDLVAALRTTGLDVYVAGNIKENGSFLSAKYAPINHTQSWTTISSVPTASTSTSGVLSSSDWNTFNNKQTNIPTSATTQYYRGDKTWQTLNTSIVPELTNLYYTQARFDSALYAVTGVALGVCPLDAGVKISTSYLPASILGQVHYNGIWNATTNTPTLPTASTDKGGYYIVSTSGTYNTIDFQVGDWVISDGTNWSKVDNTDSINSWNGRTGAITPIKADYSTWFVDLAGSYSNPSWLTALDPSKVSQTASYRFVTDTEKATWNAKLSANQTITLSGVITGSGTTAITTAMVDGALTIAKTNGLQAALDGKQANLGFTPVQQGGGTSQTTNKVYIGWSAGSVLRLQIDSTDFGYNWPIAITGSSQDSAQLNGLSSSYYVQGASTSKNQGLRTTMISLTAANANILTPSGFYDGYFTAGMPQNGWWCLSRIKHSDPTGGGPSMPWGVDFAGAMIASNTEQYCVRANNDTTWGTWRTLWHDGNLTGDQTAHNHNSTYLKLSGGTLTGEMNSDGVRHYFGKNVTPSTANNSNYSEAPLMLQRSATAGTTYHAGLGFLNNGVNAAFLFYDAATSEFRFNRHIAGALNTFWHSGNLTGDQTAHNHDSTYLKLSGGNFTGLISGPNANFTNLSVTSFTGTFATMGLAKIGTSTSYSTYAEFSNSAFFGTNNYALMQSNSGDTIINCAANKNLFFSNGNSAAQLAISTNNIISSIPFLGTSATFSGVLTVAGLQVTPIVVTSTYTMPVGAYDGQVVLIKGPAGGSNIVVAGASSPFYFTATTGLADYATLANGKNFSISYKMAIAIWNSLSLTWTIFNT